MAVNKDLVQQKLASTKNRIKPHLPAILGTVAVVTTTVAVLQQVGIQGMKKFLDEKGMLDEYLTPDQDETTED